MEISKFPTRTILFSGLLAGAFDITAAIVFLGKMKAEAVLNVIKNAAILIVCIVTRVNSHF